MNLKSKILSWFLKTNYILANINNSWYCYPILKTSAKKLKVNGRVVFKASFSEALEIEHNIRLGSRLIKEMQIATT